MQITDLPFSLYSTFVIEARHGFNKVCGLLSSFGHNLYFISIRFLQHSCNLGVYYYLTFGVMDSCFSLQQTIWLFFRDMIKGFLLAIVIGPPIVAAIITIVQVLLSFVLHEYL